MPVEIKGAYELNKALGKFAPDLKKNLNKEIRGFLAPIVKEAKSLAPAEITGLSNWTYASKGKAINKNTSVFRVGKFPKYNSSIVKAGIRSHVYPTRENRKGFVSLVQIVNASAPGAIYETAGRAHPFGQEWKPKSKSHKYSHSKNPYAGAHFVRSINSTGTMRGEDKMRGRLIYKAWADNEGKAIAQVVKAVESTQLQFKKSVTYKATFMKAA